jgi:flagellar biosynthesis regulator FlaF
LYQITITMTPVQKIQFVKELIHERAQISPAGVLKVQLKDHPSFPTSEQMIVLKKLEQEGLIKDLNVIGKAVSFWVISTFANHLNENKADNDVIAIEIGTNTLSIDKVTATVRLNTIQAIFNPKSQEFETLLKLVTTKNHQVTYADILGESASKTTKRNLTFVIRNIKEALGILPAKKARNKDIIKNIKGVGYKLSP